MIKEEKPRLSLADIQNLTDKLGYVEIYPVPDSPNLFKPKKKKQLYPTPPNNKTIIAKNTCGTCRFRKTGYCPHPHTNFDEASRCLECEIQYRIELFENHTITGVAEKPKVAVAKQWLEEWMKEQGID